MLKITNVKFLFSAADKSQFLKSDKPVIAVSGKSNVGKSSFINMLAGRKNLARTSQTPGRTRLINYFDFGAFVLADLPGYGYARVSKSEKEKWARLLDDFFGEKQNIAHVFALCDIRHNPTADDVTMINYLYARIIPFTVIATKSDKLSRAQADSSLTAIAAAFKCGKGDIIAVSSQNGKGRDETLAAIEEITKA